MGVPVRFCPPVRKPKSMDVSVVVPTLNGREQLAAALDTIAEHAPSVEVVVVNGPSADGTSGMVRDRDDVDVLVDLDERNINVARNAGLERAGGDVVAYVEYDLVIEEGWLVALREGLAAVPAVGDERGAVTGPTHRRLRAGVTTEKLETTSAAATSRSGARRWRPSTASTSTSSPAGRATPHTASRGWATRWPGSRE